MGDVSLGNVGGQTRRRSVTAYLVGIVTLVMTVGMIATPAQAVTLQDDIHSITNTQRANAGLPPLQRDATIDAVAQEWANEMSRQSTMVHSSNEWRSVRIPGGWDTNGENIAYGYAAASSVMNGWMNSSGHKANILNSRYTRMGVGYVASGRYWVQIFGGYASDRVPEISPAPNPTVSGSAKVGQRLSANVGSWATGASLAYQWSANGSAIAGATGNAFTATALQAGLPITVTVTGTKVGNRKTSRVSAPSARVLTNLGVSRIDGADRFDVAIAISRATSSGPASTVYVTTGLNYPDALSAAPAAIAQQAPLLLVEPTKIPVAVENEIRRLSPERIVIVGGEQSVAKAVEDTLSSMTGTVVRIAGANRYDVSRALAEYAFGQDGSSTAYVSNGGNFPDALSAGSPAGRSGMPILLVKGDESSIDGATLGQISSMSSSTIKIAGGPASVSSGIESSLRSSGLRVSRLAGEDRYSASIAINSEVFSSNRTAYLATGSNFPDALAGSVLAGTKDAPLFVVPGTCVPRGVLAQFARLGVSNVVLIGGASSLSPDVERLVACGW